MDLRQWKTFRLAVQMGSIRAAAKELDFSTPAASKQIHKLENELGVLLIIPGARPVKLTSIGETLYQLGGEVIETFDRMLALALSQRYTGSVSIATLPTLTSHILPEVVAEYHKRFPDVSVRLQSSPKEITLRQLKNGMAQIGLAGPPIPTEFSYEPLATFRRVLVTPLEHPLAKYEVHSLSQIAEYPLILIGQGTGTRTLLETEFHRMRIPYHVSIEVDTIDTAIRCVATGVGVTVMSELGIAPDDFERFHMQDLSHLLPVGEIGIIHLRDREMEPHVVSFAKIMKEVCGGAHFRSPILSTLTD